MKPIKVNRIHVAVDNSDHSGASVQLGIETARSFGANLVGSHVYAAKLHDVRFKQMEFTLPDEYKEDTELEKQRRIHDALITRGLQLISDSYLDIMEREASAANVPFERKLFDGRTFEPIVDDLNNDDYDLLILGALGQGAVRESDMGSVCERVLRRTTIDTMVIRDAEETELTGDGHIAVALDGSAWSWGALELACTWANTTSRGLQIVAVVAPDGAERTLLDAHLRLAIEMAASCKVKAETHMLEGAGAASLIDYLDTSGAWLAVMGRHGIDADETQALEMGSTTDTVLRRSPCNVLVTSRTFDPAVAQGAVRAA